MFRWLFFAILSLVLFLQLRGFDETLRGEQTPRGIVGYELAWSRAEADRYLQAWKQTDALETAKVSLGVDFAFLIAYPLMFTTLIGLLLGSQRSEAMRRTGAMLKRAVLLCMPLDAVENLSLWRMIDHGASDGLAHLATISASVKFLLVLAATLWCVAAIGARLTRGRAQPG
jgi:hypothetical protein